MSDDNKMEDQQAHRRFAPACFNETWELLEGLEDAPDGEDVEEVVLTAAASLWHWTQRDDVTATNRSVGAWLLSRVYAVVERPNEAVYWGERSLHWARQGGGAPFYVGYAYEGLARACVQLDSTDAERYISRAEEQLEGVDDDERESLLEQDLRELRGDVGTR